MKPPLFFILIATALNCGAQTRSTLYLGEDMDSVFIKGYTRMEKYGFFTYRHLSDHSFRMQTGSHELKSETNRDGLVLTAKSTTTYISKGEIITANENDSVVTGYSCEMDKVYHGRSAALSVLNLFSKKEDRIKQEKPYEEINGYRVEGTILQDGNRFVFERNWLQWGDDTVRVISAQNIRKRKGKIKKAGSQDGLQLMLRDQCIAAIDFGTVPQEYFLSRRLSEKQKLVIVAFLQVRELMREE